MTHSLLGIYYVNLLIFMKSCKLHFMDNLHYQIVLHGLNITQK